MLNNRSTKTRRLPLFVVVLRTEPVKVPKTCRQVSREHQRVDRIRPVIPSQARHQLIEDKWWAGHRLVIQKLLGLWLGNLPLPIRRPPHRPAVNGAAGTPCTHPGGKDGIIDIIGEVGASSSVADHLAIFTR